MLTCKVTLRFLHNCSEIPKERNILKLLCVNKKHLFSAALGNFTLSVKNITSRSITLRWSSAQRLNSTWQDRKIFIQIESKHGLKNHNFPSVIGMGNIKLFSHLSPYTEYKFTLHEFLLNFIGNSISISFNTLEDGKRYISFSKLVQ